MTKKGRKKISNIAQNHTAKLLQKIPKFWHRLVLKQAKSAHFIWTWDPVLLVLDWAWESLAQAVSRLGLS